MKEIICDPFNGADPRNNRFLGGLKMNIIPTIDSQLSRSSYEVHTLTCCSSVRQTAYNWFYVVPTMVNEDLLDRWIKEITPIFDNLQIKVNTVNSKKLIYKQETFKNVLSLNEFEGKELITIPIALSERTNGFYGITCQSRFPFGKISNVGFLIEKFCDYCVSNKITEFNDHINLVNSFIKEEYEDILSVNLDNMATTVHLPGRSYSVVLGIIVDFKNIEKDLLIDYISRLFILNKDDLVLYIQRRQAALGKDGEEFKILQVLYSKKTSHLQGYLAHHLIRAGLSVEFAPFLNQYFTIKEQLPNIGFWNTLLYTQFGFKFYYYYWLTDQRIFRNIDDEEMAKLINKSTRNSSKDFLSEFSSDMSTAVRNRAMALYLAGDFNRFHQLMKGSILVQLLPESINRFTNLRLSSDYTITSDDDKYYFIQGDDYKLRRYSKKHFKILGR